MKRLISTIAIIGFLAFPSSAGANTQTVSATAAPIKHPAKTYTAASLNVITATGPDAPGAQIFPATRAQIYFDDDFVFTAAGLPVCRAAIDGLNTALARAACPNSIVGTGAAKVALAGFTETVLDAEITAFNGPPVNGRPVLRLFSYTNAVALGTVLTGVLKPSGRSGFGKVLDVSIPTLPLSSAIIEFQTKVQRSWKYKGKVQHYVKARCATRKWRFSGTFTYAGATSKSASSNQTCRRG